MVLLLGVSLGSLLAGGILSWLQFKRTVESRVFQQLTSVRVSKSNQIESYIQSLRNHVETLSEDSMVISAMVEFNSAYKELENQVIPNQWRQKIAAYYRQEFFPRLSKNILGEQVLTNYRPTAQAEQYLQYHYIANNSFPVGEKSKLIDAQDGSDYSKIHQKYHRQFRNISHKFGYYDLFLIDFQTGEIVYSVEKETDYGTSLERGPYRRSNLAAILSAVKDNPGKGFVQVVDFQPYSPSYAVPAAFFAAPIYNGPHIVGVLAVQFPVEKVNQILTVEQNWDGLGKSGEVYLVGSDLLMRSASRFLIEDPQGYEAKLNQSGLSDRTIALIKQLNTSILLQPVKTKAARSAIAGVSGTVIVNDYRGVEVLSSHGKLKMQGLEWGILAEIDSSEAFAPLHALQTYFIIVTAIIILLVIGFSTLVAQNFVKPIQTIINAGERVKQGEGDVEVKLERKDELEELGQAFNSIMGDIRSQRELVHQQKLDNNALLLNFLPDTVVARIKQGEQQIIDYVPQATVLFARIVGLSQLSAHKQNREILVIFSQLINAFDESAEQYGVSKQSTVGDNYVAVCGLSRAYLDHSERTVKFAMEMLEVLDTINQEYQVDLGLRIAIHSGPLIAGIIGHQKFAYQIWGETVDITANLSTKVGVNSILVTQTVHDLISDQYLFVKYPSMEVGGMGELPIWMLLKTIGRFSRQVELVQTSFINLLSQGESTAKLFYERLFEIAPEVRALFKENMVVQQRKFMATLQVAVNGLSDVEKILPVVQELGRKHGHYGITHEQYEILAEALIWTLEQKLGENFTPEVKAAWISAYNLLTAVMKEAATSTTKETQPVAVES
ncbi:MAG: adenylate/guanylate cyclase domain-containing protein [Calothrix sp. MO_167.B42]|nr:adenylate/guanylate cyclase domain-containing protein [Calothrix sp. MO_167.B42]